MQKKSQKYTGVLCSALLFGFFLTSCSKSFSTHQTAIDSQMESIVCPESYEVTLDFFSQLMARKDFSESVISAQSFAEAMSVDTAFQGVAGSYAKTNLYELYIEFAQDIKYLSAFESNANLVELVSVLKVEDTENHLRKELVEKYKIKINKISQNLQSMGYACSDKKESSRAPAGEAPAPPAVEEPSRTVVRTERELVTETLLQAMKKVFAVTYQSCAVLEKAPLVKEDKNVEGLREQCCHESGRGLTRHISSLSSVVKTHPYIQKSYAAQCFDLKKSPLIYDFGGRPAFTRGASGKLNFFANWGGSEVLGYDCSAMVYTVLMGAGFRLKENKMFVASDVVAAQSRQFLDPESKGWSCLNSVAFTNETSEPLLEGDIASQDGHTFMIYRVGKDPYGLNSVTDCKKIDFENFDFDILQSSPSKDGVGVNVYSGKDYLLTNDTMKNGFTEYAKNYCERIKNGSKKVISLNYFSIVRMSTKSSCRMPIIQFQNESCVKECI